MTKIVLISDTHNQHDKLTIPECDILIHAGDATMTGYSYEADKFLAWFREQPARHRVFVPGNHDFVFEERRAYRFQLPDIHVLIDQMTTLEGIKIYGSPWQFDLPSWAFHAEDPPEKVWDSLPDEIDILVTHIPPFEIGDKVNRMHPGELTPHVGCRVLRDHVVRIQPKFHVYGHIHEGRGEYGFKCPTRFLNVANLDDRYRNIREPVVIHIGEADAPGTISEDSSSLSS